MDKKYMLVARNKFNDEVSIIEIKSEKTNELQKMNSLIEIDKVTSKYFASIDDFKKRVQNGKYENCDIYITHKKRACGEDRLNFRDVVFENSGADINHFLNYVDNKGKISLNDSYLSKYLGELIYRLKNDSQYKEAMTKIFPHLSNYFNLAITDQLKLDSIEYLNFLKRLSSYLEIRKLIMATNQFDGKIKNFYQERITAKYPVYVFVSDHLSDYQRNKLDKTLSMQEFIKIKPLLKKNDNNYVKGQMELKYEEDDDLEFITEEEMEQMTGIDELGNLNNLHKK